MAEKDAISSKAGPQEETVAKAKPVVKAVARKAVAKAVPKKPANSQITKTVAKPAPVKKARAGRPIAKAVVKAASRTPATTPPPTPSPVPVQAPIPEATPAPPEPTHIVARPDVEPDVMMRRALRLHNEGNLDGAASLYQRILDEEPEFAPAWINLGVLLRRTGQIESSVICLRRGVALKQDDGAAWSNLGNALRAANRLDDASLAQEQAIDLAPDIARIHYNYGLTIRDKGDLHEASRAIRRASLLGYSAPELDWDAALTKLLAGDLIGGFEDYESRWKLGEIKRLHSDIPEWDGSPLNGRTLLVWAEQGIGDTIQFCRYVIDSADGIDTRDGNIVLEVQAPLARILQRSPQFSNITVIPRGGRLPKADVQIPLLSLPRLRRTDLDSIPDHCPYIIPPPDARAPEGLRKDRMKVGIVWAGKPSHKNDRNRSITLESFTSLFDLPHTDFYSLQKGPSIQDHTDLALGPLLKDLGSSFNDFADTAAAIRALDLVITVDTSAAHMAGAMAKPVWVLLPYAPDWRWMLKRDDSPWYPSMTLYRQTSPGDWGEVFRRVRTSLIRRIKVKRRR